MIVDSSQPDFWPRYKELLDSQQVRSPLYGRIPLDYYRSLALEKGCHVEDRSFVLLCDNAPVAGFVGACVSDDIKDLMAYQIPCTSIENTSKLGKNVVKKYVNRFSSLLGDINGTVRYRDFLVGGNITSISRFLLSHGANSETIFSQVIDLTEDESVLKRRIRKSYHSLINWGKRELTPKVIDSTNICWDQVEDFRDLHIHAAGRETRSKQSWRKIFDWVRSDEAFLVFGFVNGELVSAGMFEYNNICCIYGVSASRRDLFDKPMSHAIIWTAMMHAKKIGCSVFEMGRQDFSDSISRKELGISDFKAGFGGQTSALLDLKLDNAQERIGKSNVSL